MKELTDLTPEDFAAIQADLDKWESGSEIRRHFEASRAKRQAEIQPIFDAIANGERLTAEDYAIRINPFD